MELKGLYTNNEAVINDKEAREHIYATLLHILNPERYQAELSEMKEGYYARRLLVKAQEGKELREAFKAIEAEDEASKVYRRFADTPDEAVDMLAKKYYAPGEHFVATREPAVRQAYSTYIASTLIVALRGRWTINTWWRLADWGFSVLPYNEKEEEIAFPYRSYEELEGTDKEAFDMLVEEIYSLCEDVLFSRLQLDKKLKAEEIEDYKPEYPTYPMELQEIDDILQVYDGKLTEEELLAGWDCDVILYAPMLVSRFGEAMYYALKYKGSEYQEYISSLNVAEDWDKVYRDYPDGHYAKVMEE